MCTEDQQGIKDGLISEYVIALSLAEHNAEICRSKKCLHVQKLILWKIKLFQGYCLNFIFYKISMIIEIISKPKCTINIMLRKPA